MANHVQLKAEKREMLGKKVRRLRSAGILPATVYGNHMEPQSIQVDMHEFQGVLKAAGRTQLIDLTVGTEKSVAVFVKQTAVNAKRNALLHVEFHQANLRQKMTSSVPLHFVGESQAVREGGILLTLTDHVLVESLPDDVPAGIDVDISALEEMNATLHVSDLSVPFGVTLVTAPEEQIAKVTPPVSEAALEEDLATPEAPAAEAQAEGGTAAGEATEA